MDLADELTAVFGRMMKFALLNSGKRSSDQQARREALEAPVLVYLAEFSLPSLHELEGVSAAEALFPLGTAISEAFAAPSGRMLTLADGAIRLRGAAMEALDAAGDEAVEQHGLSSFGERAPLVEALALASAARQAYDAAAGDGSQPDEGHLRAFATLVRKAWLAGEAA
jgi:hypothetical protein